MTTMSLRGLRRSAETGLEGVAKAKGSKIAAMGEPVARHGRHGAEVEVSAVTADGEKMTATSGIYDGIPGTAVERFQ
jgi:hypothetical protein